MGTLNERSSEYRLERAKTRKKIMCILAVIIAVVAAVVIVFFIWNWFRTKAYTGFKEITTFERLDSSNAKYEYYEGNLLKYSRDGASALDENGNVLWNGSYEMNNPMVDTCGEFVAIADQGGKEVHIYSGSDAGTILEMPLPVTMVQVASQGVIAVVLEDTGSNTVALYNPYATSDKLLVSVPTNVSTDGYPVDIALSNDGQSLATAYVTVQGGSVMSNVCFYNFSEVGQDSNRIVGGKTYSDSMAVKLEYLGDDTLCVLQDNGFTLFSNMKQPKEIASQVFEQEISSVLCDNGYIGFLFEEAGDESTYGIKLYNTGGKVVLDKKINYEYESVSMKNDEMIFFSNMGCAIMRANGSEKINCTFESVVQNFIPAKGKDCYYIIEENSISKVKLTED